MPAYIPISPEDAVRWSGVRRARRRRRWCCPSATRRLARWWLLGLLVAVFPANVHMAVDPDDVAARGVPSTACRAGCSGRGCRSSRCSCSGPGARPSRRRHGIRLRQQPARLVEQPAEVVEHAAGVAEDALASSNSAIASSTGRRAATARRPSATSGLSASGGLGVVDRPHDAGTHRCLELGVVDPLLGGELAARDSSVASAAASSSRLTPSSQAAPSSAESKNCCADSSTPSGCVHSRGAHGSATGVGS